MAINFKRVQETKIIYNGLNRITCIYTYTVKQIDYIKRKVNLSETYSLKTKYLQRKLWSVKARSNGCIMFSDSLVHFTISM